MRKLHQEPVKENITRARLPDGTHIVSLPDESYKLSFPIDITATEGFEFSSYIEIKVESEKDLETDLQDDQKKHDIKGRCMEQKGGRVILGKTQRFQNSD